MGIYGFTVTNVVTGFSFPMSAHGATLDEALAKLNTGIDYVVSGGELIATFAMLSAS